jgi:hypothetical protein
MKENLVMVAVGYPAKATDPFRSLFRATAVKRDLFLGQCVDIAQPDLCVCGGFSDWLKI